MTDVKPFDVQICIPRRARKFLKNHLELQDALPGIKDQLARQPRRGTHIKHLKAQYHCARRWEENSYRILYSIHDVEQIVAIFDVGPRPNIYRR